MNSMSLCEHLDAVMKEGDYASITLCSKDESALAAQHGECTEITHLDEDNRVSISMNLCLYNDHLYITDVKITNLED